MYDKLGPLGIVGVLAIVVGVGLIAYQDYIIAAGIALVVGGLGLVVKALVSGVLSAWGMV